MRENRKLFSAIISNPQCVYEEYNNILILYLYLILFKQGIISQCCYCSIVI